MAETLTIDETPADQPEFSAEEQDSLALGQQLQAEADAANPLLAGKFKDQGELEKAYLELQSKLGEDKPEPSQEQEQSEPSEFYNKDGSVNYDTVSSDYGEQLGSVFKENSIDPYEMSGYFDENGSLSDEHYAQLEKAGLGRDLVDQYLQGSGAVATADLSQNEVNAIKQSVGGEDEYNQIIQWAGQNLAQEQIQGFDALVETGNAVAIQMAVAGLQSMYESNMGKDGKMLTGKAAPTTGTAFRSQAELVAAMADPRYDRDPAYRQDVVDKLERSNLQF